MSHTWLPCKKTLLAIQPSSLRYSWNKPQSSICLKKTGFKCLRQITQGTLSGFIYFITFKSTLWKKKTNKRKTNKKTQTPPKKTKPKNKPLNEETFGRYLTSLNGISFLPYRRKPGWFIVHQTQVCTLQPLKCVCAAIPIAELKLTCGEFTLKFWRFFVLRKCWAGH